MGRNAPTPDRFWRKVVKGPECWEWSGATNGSKGYGVMWAPEVGHSGRAYVHRVSYMLAFGPIADGMFVLHRCDNPKCVRPEHLFLGTNTDNMRDCAAKGRVHTNRGMRRTHCKNGHELVGENVYNRPDRPGERQCRACTIEKRRALHLLTRGRKQGAA